MLASLVLLTGYDLRHRNTTRPLSRSSACRASSSSADTREVDCSAGMPLALGSAVGAYAAARLVTSESAKV
jgi:uncharacterized membrane protein YfcA